MTAGTVRRVTSVGIVELRCRIGFGGTRDRPLGSSAAASGPHGTTRPRSWTGGSGPWPFDHCASDCLFWKGDACSSTLVGSRPALESNERNFEKLCGEGADTPAGASAEYESGRLVSSHPFRRSPSGELPLHRVTSAAFGDRTLLQHGRVVHWSPILVMFLNLGRVGQRLVDLVDEIL